MPNIIIVSNRLPVNVKKTDSGLEFSPSSGGLATGLSSYAKRRNTKWIGWPGIVSDELNDEEKRAITLELRKDNCYPVFLSKKQVDEFYNGYSNNVLWPLFHNMDFGAENNEKHWRTYQSVNQLYTETVLALSEPKSTIWIHDYQLFLMPRMLRKERPRDAIGFFLHIPFPDAKSYQELPQAKSITKGLLGADLIGFHTSAYAANFLDTCQELNLGLVSENEIIVGDRAVKVTDFPLGIDYSKFSNASRSRSVQKELAKLKLKYGKYKVILTVDRLDPSKGIAERVEAYRDFLEQNPEQRGKVIMMMLAVPSRTDIAAYQQLKERVERLVDETNETYGRKNWQPIVYMFKSVPFQELAAMYRLADVAFIAPLRDGMNLVAKEYVASQPDKKGVLILSNTAGAAQELKNALLVSHSRPHSLVSALSKALTMKPRDLKKRLSHMQQHLSVNNVQVWASDFMNSLQDSKTGQLVYTKRLTPVLQKQLIETCNNSKRRLLLLDYDGVLAPFESKPSYAKPSKSIIDTLQILTKKPETKVVIISGRSRDDLEKWFKDVSVTLAAEHGALTKEPGKKWQKHAIPPDGWKEIIQPSLEKYAAQTPGAFVEEKECSLVWHYRKAGPYYSQKNIVILKRALKPFLRRYELGMFSGKGILEIKGINAHKGAAAEWLLSDKDDFILAIGDDYTDEDMFESLPERAHTIKVGRGKTEATFRLKDVAAVQRFLRKLAEH